MFGQRLKALRLEKGMTQQQLADFLDIEKSNISRFESGKQSPSSDNRIKMAKLFNVSVDYMLGLSEHKSLDKEKSDKISKEAAALMEKINKLPPEKRILIENLIDNF
ncbi:XRE family transcriptional regulator [Bacillus thuringiensis]|nr:MULTISPECIES: helix-turn-helix transcriptional regulator [Bacillus]PEF28263.1 XRE family transcriptional regulator [Bacillus thuringiensis]PET83868.1 XRE family transcriptional regulator [Bacillus thuringiensis]PEU89666.1 XRE family transcriptional regulator [Bacillus sp. AFS012607]PEY52874.1 XRE family transcriptional regulator [Bacillus thuringiensis]PFA39584.1 XRE family transcriptional regulator [Bacillus thuringiensis]